jgi:Hepatitis C virus NS3 protease
VALPTYREIFMAFIHVDKHLGLQPIATTDTVQNHPLGMIVRAYDPTYGECEFVYLKGVASTVATDWVIYDQYAGTTTRTVAGSRGPVAVAMSANVASQYGWYCISGAINANAATVAAAGNVYVTATAGRCDDATVSGDKVDGARWKTADGTPAANQAICQLDRPALNGNG